MTLYPLGTHVFPKTEKYWFLLLTSRADSEEEIYGTQLMTKDLIHGQLLLT